MNQEETKSETQRIAEFRPQLAFYHPNARGVGAAVKFELHPAHDNTSGCIMMTLANQISPLSSGGQSESPFARFDWEHRIAVKLDFTDLSQMLMVLKGLKDSIGEQKGLYHRTPNAVARILLRRVMEPVKGYSLGVYRTANNVESKVHVFLSESEALGFTCAVEGVMSVIAFGIPKVIPHDTSAYRAQFKRN